jgi:hypothetical protein
VGPCPCEAGDAHLAAQLLGGLLDPTLHFLGRDLGIDAHAGFRELRDIRLDGCWRGHPSDDSFPAVLWRPAAALLTGPIAFFVAGAIDLGVFVAAAARESLRRRLNASGFLVARLRPTRRR